MTEPKSFTSVGSVIRINDYFLVASPIVLRTHAPSKVWRDPNGIVRCSCTEYEGEIENSDFRCEHIRVVRHALSISRLDSPSECREDDNIMPGRYSNKQYAAVPRESARGVQKHDEILIGSSATGQSNKNIGPKSSRLAQLIGETEMNADNSQRTLTPDSKELEHIENSSNVIGFPSKLRRLRNSVNPDLISNIRDGHSERDSYRIVDYLEWHTVADILDDTTPNWNHSVKDIRQIGNIVTVTVAIIIDGVSREGIGTALANSESGIKNAENEALKRASVKFGIARKLYSKKPEVLKSGDSLTYSSADFPANPIARTLSDLVTGKQLGMIRGIARENGIDAEKECTEKMSCNTSELSKRAASRFISHLQNIQDKTDREIKIPMRSMG